MRIAVNTRFLLKNKLEGIGWFTYESLKRITRTHPEHEFYFFFDRDYDEEFIFSDNVHPVVIHPQARHPFLFYLWFEHQIPRHLKKVNADIFISTDGFLSLKTDVPTLLVIHDLAFEHFPADVGFWEKKYYNYFMPKFAEKAARIATVSEYSRQDIIKQYGVPASKIDVVYNGSSEIYRPFQDVETHEVRNKFELKNPYFIFAGAIQPRKNLDNILKAFEKFKTENNSNVQLVIAGRKAWKYGEAMEIYEKMKFMNDVKLVGHLASDDLAKLMGGALALLYVSRFEGFGIPIVEAMSCHTPVITSNVSSMPEVAGDAALKVDPYSIEEISEAIKKISTDENLRKELVEKGKVQAQKFSWEKTASRLWKSVEKVIQES